jgi:hypothetical protein
MEKNLKINGFNFKINQAALVHGEKEKAILFCGNKNNFWRNSLHKNWNGKGVSVKCVNFEEVIRNGTCVKIDIEGAEMPILENTKKVFSKLIFEWSFDIDNSLLRYQKIINKLKVNYEVKAPTFENSGHEVWPSSWFPACQNVFCYRK